MVIICFLSILESWIWRW